MRALIDLRCLETPSALRGIGRYARELAGSLGAAASGEWEFVALSWTGVGRSAGIGDLRYPGPRRGIGLADRFLLPALLRRGGIDLYHATAYALPVAGAAETALVLTVHDLVADLYPASLSWRHRLAFRRTFRSAAVAGRVITVSEATRRDLLSRYPLDPERVVAVPNGVAGSFRQAGRPAAASGLPAPFVLYVGGLDPLKNAPFLLEVLEAARPWAPELHLVLAGEGGERGAALARAAARRGLAERVHVVGYLPDDRLAAAYREATAFLFPSRHEGFGLPPLEAMAAGCPVVSSPAGALAELLGEAALLRDPSDARAWADALRSLLVDPELRSRLIAKGTERAAGYTWEETARRTLAVYRAALQERGRG